MAEITPICNGTISTSGTGEAVCSVDWGWHISDADVLPIADWMEIWPGIVLLFVVAFGFRILIKMFNVT